MVFWHWLTLGILLIAFEIMVPGSFLLWPGIAAVLTGMLAYMAPGLGWETHALVFAGLTVASAILGRRVYSRLRVPSDEPDLNRRARSYIGTVHALATPIVGGSGRVTVGDTTWKVAGPDLAAGTKVIVTGAEGIVLTVEKAEEP
ncbi:MAG: NfeD family protein [Magnetospirillum sp.]|nr:NfeD family protein [Magnetospirillum sp.]